jgi:3-methylfumaryl-CoA hydratase
MVNKDTGHFDTSALAHLKSWIGRTDSAYDSLTPAPMQALSATLDRNDLNVAKADALPYLWHWLYFLSTARQSEIGPDGHARRGDFLPPVTLPRRMWAGGRLKWQSENPLLIGDDVRRVSTIESVEYKAGHSGDLLFVLVRHQIYNQLGLALTEEHDIVYRAAALPSDALPRHVAASTDAAWQREISPDAVLLFRYSALTFNGHRIHYDRQYVTAVEGYPGLIVHGPLIATLLLDLVRQHNPTAHIESFKFRALKPTFDLHSFRVNGHPSEDGKTVKLWAQDHEGWLTMQGCATLV